MDCLCARMYQHGGTSTTAGRFRPRAAAAPPCARCPAVPPIVRRRPLVFQFTVGGYCPAGNAPKLRGSAVGHTPKTLLFYVFPLCASEKGGQQTSPPCPHPKPSFLRNKPARLSLAGSAPLGQPNALPSSTFTTPAVLRRNRPGKTAFTLCPPLAHTARALEGPPKKPDLPVPSQHRNRWTAVLGIDRAVRRR